MCVRVCVCVCVQAIWFFILFFLIVTSRAPSSRHATRPVPAVLEAMDNGKPVRETRDADINVVARWLYHYAGWAQIMDREMPEMTSVGVVAGIVAWNFPLMLLVWKVGGTIICHAAQPCRFFDTAALSSPPLTAHCDSFCRTALVLSPPPHPFVSFRLHLPLPQATRL